MRMLFGSLVIAMSAASALAGVGDPQIKTAHPWYPGELSCSTFQRLFATQAALPGRPAGESWRMGPEKGVRR